MTNELWNSIKAVNSSDENVSKYVFENKDSVSEAVLYKYPTYDQRTVICCSTQSGCPVGCRFCGAGDSFVRSLTEEEIVSQPVHLLEETGVPVEEIKRLQIMFMSMGEPLLNLKNVVPAIHRLHNKYPNAALLLSTSAPKVDYSLVRKVSRDVPTVGLQFSIHESTDERRNNLIPFKAKLSLAEIAEEGKKWYEEVGRQPFFNYCAHEENSSKDDADRIASLFDPEVWQATISVVCERDEHVAAANKRQQQLAENFQTLLLERGFETRMFDPAGQDDIGGGCGQLWFVQDWMAKNTDKARPSVGRRLPIVHAPRV